jgi:type I restriction enzyme S subunit
LLRPDPQKVDGRFLLYALQSPYLQHQIGWSEGTGSTVSNLRIPVLEALRIPTPPLAEQHEIATLLGGLDDRITLLRETNTLLEQIAQTIFKSWFVDFDPVRAKQEGRIPEGMDEETAALFPDSFEESELGRVPRGWQISNLGECTTHLNRGISPKYLETGGILVINQKCVRDFAVDLAKARRHDPSQRKIDGRELQVGDVLVNSTGVGTLGRVAQIVTLDQPAIVDSHVTVVRASNDVGWNYLGQFLMRKQPEIADLGEGTTGQTELSRGKLSRLKMVVPSKEVLVRFDSITKPLRLRIAENFDQAKILANLRDTLLPRLISGKLRLPEAEAMLSPPMHYQQNP